MDGRLQQVVHSIEEMSGAGQLGKLLQHLQAQEEVLIQAMPQLDDLLPVLNPAAHTLGMVFILHCKAAAVPLSNLQAVNTFLTQCRSVLLGGDPEQIRMVPKEFVAVCCKFSAAAIAIKSPLFAVRALHAAALALQPGPTHFTPLHAEFLKLCILAKTYTAAKPMIEQPLLQVDKQATMVAPRDLLLYHYYAGIVHIAFKDFKQAMQSFMLCCSAPCTVLHAIMVEAYKKCVFCALIETGELPKLPKYTTAVLQRHLKTGVAPYTEYATAFASKKVRNHPPPLAGSLAPLAPAAHPPPSPSVPPAPPNARVHHRKPPLLTPNPPRADRRWPRCARASRSTPPPSRATATSASRSNASTGWCGGISTR